MAKHTAGPTPATDDAPPLVLSLGGRVFVEHTDLTFEHELYMTRYADVDSLAINMPADSDAEGKAKYILGAILRSPHLPEMLAGVLKERDEEWSEPAALANATLFRGLKSGADTRQLWTVVGRLVVGFYAAVAPVLPPSLNASAVPPTAGDGSAPATSTGTV